MTADLVDFTLTFRRLADPNEDAMPSVRPLFSIRRL